MRTDRDVATDRPIPPETEPQRRHGDEDLQAQGRALRRAIPDVYRGFAGLRSAALADGALDARTKELLALALSVAEQCDGCIEAHADGAARRGASEEEVAEALGVVVMMGGGPATSYAPHAFAAFRDARARHDAVTGRP
ncbi:carboxymuconolactone decarboxylase family protein [Actinomycetospora lutea]|uniref:carboxymuconolactone decarboxylase family protein n=1 Tax=Actinomycetospora lutea TaxID=663604 RepID=UPI0023652745|nr:carboxymuconolactone decarboxylase family protein [Actinomycetospora lutea]MDD7939066.1 carboxymuconolactone decarboxylase family protein [Actinomycetospora lutea]